MNSPPRSTDPHSCPKLREHLAARRTADGLLFHDPYRVGQPVHLTPLGAEITGRLDGTRSLRDVQADLMRLTGGKLVPLEAVGELVASLDEALLLDSPRLADLLSEPVRPPACIGTYSADPSELRGQLTELFTAPGGPGLPGEYRPSPHGRLRAALLPHMDYARGNVTYGHGFKELVEGTDAAVFVVVATSHYSPHRFTLTRQHFDTPLGRVETDQSYVNRLEREYGPGLFADPLAHHPEHSIELEVVLLQFLLGGRRPFRIVPLLVGSFGEFVDGGAWPADDPDVRRMVAALRAAEAACPDPVCYLISGDLAHIGPKFDPSDPRAAGEFLAASRRQDEAILKQVEAADPAGYFGVVAAEEDRRRICGLPPTWLTLEAVRPRAGRVLHYQQYAHPKGHESVSFAAAGFYA
ncbi:MAG: AmmeMemoRadiSam system protein B [Gemmataceae bacterium]|nr:AmmeMemoRadiSam system protein B [Gemmataceae bacterium]